MAEQALSDVKVLDLTWHIAGPYCTKLLAGLGAEVIKVERPGQGDPARSMGPFYQDDPHPEKSCLFLYLNTGKKSITLDLKSVLGRSMLKELVKKADILVENFRHGVMERLGLDYSALERINPKLVMTSISNFGKSGPYCGFKASDLTLMSLGGLVYMNGDPLREPITFGGWQAQYQAGVSGFAATMTALHHAEHSGEGQHVDISIMECIASVLECFDDYWAYMKEPAYRTGHCWGGNNPWGLYPCKDGYIGIISGRPRHLAELHRWTGVEALLTPEWNDINYRRANRDLWEALALPWLAERNKEELWHEAQKRRAAVLSIVATPQDIVNSPHEKERGFLIEVEHPVTGKHIYPGAPLRMSQTPFQIGRAPLMGEHNAEVYARLGYAREDLVKLRERGII